MNEEMTAIQSDSPTVNKSGMRIFLAIAASKAWRVKTTDIKSAFLQGQPLSRDIYLQPPKEARTPKGYIWKLNHCIYGLNDAARHFFHSVKESLISLKCRQSRLDPAIFCYYQDECLCGIIVCHVDDFLHAGEHIYDEKVMTGLRDRFYSWQA